MVYKLRGLYAPDKVQKEAEELLLEELDLLDYKPKHTLTFSAFKKEINQTERIDAEYYQPKYEEIIKKIENYKNGFDIVKNILNFNKKNFFPKENELYKFNYSRNFVCCFYPYFTINGLSTGRNYVFDRLW